MTTIYKATSYKPGRLSSKLPKNLKAYQQGWDPIEGVFRTSQPWYRINKKAINAVKELLKNPLNPDNIEGPLKLQDIGFDPIDEIVSQLVEIQKLLDKELASASPRIMAISNLTAAKLKLNTVLLEYRYRKAGASTNEFTEASAPIRIILTNDTDSDKST